jgi:hypothetical protein
MAGISITVNCKNICEQFILTPWVTKYDNYRLSEYLLGCQSTAITAPVWNFKFPSLFYYIIMSPNWHSRHDMPFCCYILASTMASRGSRFKRLSVDAVAEILTDFKTEWFYCKLCNVSLHPGKYFHSKKDYAWTRKTRRNSTENFIYVPMFFLF